MNETHKLSPLFREVQTFGESRLIRFITVIVFVACAFPMLQWGFTDASSREGSFDFALVFPMIVGFLITTLMFSARLIVEVRDDGLYVRFVPFHIKYKMYPFDQIQSFHARQYNPIREYGGWGIRYGSSGKAFNVYGNRGIQIQFSDGGSLLIGSQKPDQLVSAMQQASGRTGA